MRISQFFGIFSLICILLANAPAEAQSKSLRELKHTISVTVGYGSSRYFPGPSSTLSYSFHVNNNRFILSAGTIIELQIFDGEERQSEEWALSYHRVFPVKKFDLSIGGGIAYNVHRLDINDVYVAQSHEMIKLKDWGFPYSQQSLIQQIKNLI